MRLSYHLPFACVAVIFMLSHAVGVSAQDPDPQVGMRLHDSYVGGKIDTISSSTGGLVVDIPLMSYPQRGGELTLDFALHYENRGAYGAQICILTCQWTWFYRGSGFEIVDTSNMALGGTSGVDHSSPWLVQQVRDAKGSMHTMGKVGSVQESLDATGIQINSAGLIVTPGGVRITPSTAATCNGPNLRASLVCESPLREDTNGNKIAFSNSAGWTDTMGRSIPLTVSTTDYSGCTGPLTTTAASIWNLPAPNNGTYSLKFCYASVATTVGYLQGSFTAAIAQIKSVVRPDGTAWTFLYDSAGNLAQVSLPTGGTVSYGWASFNCPPSGSRFVNPAIGSRTLNPNDGVSVNSVWTYNYLGCPSGPYPFTSSLVITDPLGNDAVHTSTTLAPDPFSSSFYETQVLSYQGSRTTGSLLKTINKEYSFTEAQLGNTFPRQVFEVVPTRETIIWPNGKQSKVEHDYDTGHTFTAPDIIYNGPYAFTYGRAVADREYDYGVGTTGPLLRQTLTSFKALGDANYLNNNLLDLVSSVTIKDGSGTQKSLTTFGFDAGTRGASGVSTQLDPSPPAAPYFGNQTSESHWLSGATVSTTSCPVSVANGNLTVSRTYYDTGNIQQVVDACGHTTTRSYSLALAGGYVTQVQNPDTNSPNLSHHITSANYDFNSGLLSSSTDQNGQQTTYTYDALFRLTAINYPDGGANTYSYPDAVTIERQRKIDSSPRWTDEFLKVDGLARQIRMITLNDETPSYDQIDTCYDLDGAIGFVSYPFQGAGFSTGRDCTGSVHPGDASVYDALGRVKQITHSDGTAAATSYVGASTNTLDEGSGTLNRQRIFQTDGLGRLISVCEVTGTALIGTGGTPSACSQDIPATGFLTTYSFDTLGNMVSTTQGGLAARTFSFDSLGRLSSSNNPEAGNITFAYDADGLLISKVSPKPNQTNSSITLTTTMVYDLNHRLRTKSFSDSTPTSTFNYDETTALGIPLTYTTGRDSSEVVAGSIAGEVFSYDKIGRITINSQCAPQNCSTGGMFPVVYTYDLAGNLTSQTNGANVTLTHSINRALRPTAISSSLADASHPGTLLSSCHYNAAGLLLSATFGNGVTETRTYDARHRILSATNGSIYSFSIPSGSTGYAGNGSILSASDSINGNWTYTYDAFNRLVGANQNAGQAVYSFDYDRYGNRWHQNGPHSLSVSFSASNNRMDGYSYDASGNLLNDGTTAYTYDGESRITSATNSIAGVTNYSYRADGRRVRKSTASGTVDFVYDLAQHEVAEFSSTGIWNRGEVYGAGRHLATYSGGPGGTTYFVHSDWLGTERSRSTFSGSVYESCTSLPFGDWLSCAGASDVSPMHFTGKEHDKETGLEYFGARYYSSTFGRFVTVDSSASPTPIPFAKLDDPQTLNLYEYVGNNPTTGLDPDGHQQMDKPVEGWNKYTYRADPGIDGEMPNIHVKRAGVQVARVRFNADGTETITQGSLSSELLKVIKGIAVKRGYYQLAAQRTEGLAASRALRAARGRGGRGGRGGGGTANAIAFFALTLLDAYLDQREAAELDEKLGYHYEAGLLMITDLKKAGQSLEEGTVLYFEGKRFVLHNGVFWGDHGEYLRQRSDGSIQTCYVTSPCYT
jgi:RHS repeat-associated protein